MSFDFDTDKEIERAVEKRLREGISDEKNKLLNGLLADFKKLYADIEESTILSALYDEFILVGSSMGDKKALENVKRRILLYRDTHRKQAEDEKQKKVFASVTYEDKKKPQPFVKSPTFSERVSDITRTVSSFFRNPKHFAKNIYKSENIEERRKHKQILAAYLYDVVDKGAAYYSANKAIFESDTAYILNHFFADNKLFYNKTGGKMSGREAVNTLYSLAEEYGVAYTPFINGLKRRINSPKAPVSIIDRRLESQNYIQGERLHTQFMQTSDIALGIRRAVVDRTRDYRSDLFALVNKTGVYKGKELSIDFANKKEREDAYLYIKKSQALSEAVNYVKQSPWYKDKGKFVYDAFGIHHILTDAALIKQIEKAYEASELNKNKEAIKAEVLMDEFGRRFVRRYIRDERGILVSTVDIITEKKKKPALTKVRKFIYDKFFKVEEQTEEDTDRYYSKQHKGFFFKDEKEHTYSFEDEATGTIEKVPGITRTIAHFLGGAYDEPYSETNRVGIKKGKQQFYSEEARENGTAIHALVNRYFRTGLITPSNSRERQPGNIDTAVRIIFELEKLYPKKEGWEINTEKLINSPVWKNSKEFASDKFASSIDILVSNKALKLVDILDIKTGKLTDNLNKKKVQYQLSAEAYFYLSEYNKHQSKDNFLSLRKLRAVSINKSNKFLPKIEIKDFPFIGEEKLNKLFSAKYANAPAGVAFSENVTKNFINLDINPTYIKDINPFTRSVAFEMFPTSNLPARKQDLLHRKMIPFDLETTGTNRSKFEIQSLSYAVFDMSETEQRALLRDLKENYFLVSDESYLSQEAQSVHHITNARVREMFPNARQINSADIEAFMSIAEGNVLVGHNEINFDLPVLRQEYIRLLWEEGYNGKQVAEKMRKFDAQIASISIFDTFEFYKSAPITKSMEEFLGSYNRFSDSPWDFYEGLKNSEIFQSYNKRFWHKNFDPSKLHSSTYDMLLTAVIAQEAVFGRHPDSKLRERASAILKQMFGYQAFSLFNIDNNGDAYSLFRTKSGFILNEPEFALRAGIKFIRESNFKQGQTMDTIAWEEDLNKGRKLFFDNPVRVVEHNGYIFFYDREIIDRVFPNNLSDKELGELLYNYAKPEMENLSVSSSIISKRLLTQGIYDIIDIRSGNNMADIGTFNELMEKLLAQLKLQGENLFSSTGKVIGSSKDLADKMLGLVGAQKELNANLFMHDAMTATNVDDFDLAVAQVLSMYSPRSKQYKNLSERFANVRTRKFFDTSTRMDELYNALHRAKAPLSLITTYGTDEFTGDSKSFNNLLKGISQAGKINTVLKEQGLELGESDWGKVIKSENPYDLLKDEAFMAALGQNTVKDRLRSITKLEDSSLFGISKKDRARLHELAKATHSIEEFSDGIDEVAKKADRANVFVSRFAASLGQISLYDPERLFSAGYHQISNIHRSLSGVVPGFLNTSVTKMLMGGVQDYEYGWQKWKYGLRTAQPAFSIAGSLLGAMAGAPFGASVQLGAMGGQIGSGLAAWGTQMVGNRYERAINETGLFFSSRFNKMGALIAPAIAALNLFTKALKVASVPLLAGLGMGIYQYKRALANMSEVDTPLYNLTGISYGRGYNELSRGDYLFGMRRGATNSIIEGIEFAKQGLFTLGRYDKNKLISAAMLGILNTGFMNPGTNGVDNYKEMMDTLWERYKNTSNKGRFMYLLNEFNPEMAKQFQTRTDMDTFFKTARGERYANRQIYYNDLTYDQSNEFKAIRGIQASFGESIKNSLMKIAAGIYNWKGFDFMNKYVGIIGSAANAFAEDKPDTALKIIGAGIRDFLKGIKDTWKEIKDKLQVKGIGEIIINEGKRIGLMLAKDLLDFADTVLDILGKIEDPVKGFFLMLYDQFKKLFNFIGQVRLKVDLNKLKNNEPGGIQLSLGYAAPAYGADFNKAFDRFGGSLNGEREISSEFYSVQDNGSNRGTLTMSEAAALLFKKFNVPLTSRFRRNSEGFLEASVRTGNIEGYNDVAFILRALKENSLPLTEEGIRTLLTNTQSDFFLNQFSRDPNKKAAIAKAAYLFDVPLPSNAIDNIFPSKEEIASWLGIGQGSSLIDQGHKYIHETRVKIENAEGELLKEEAFTDVVYPSVPRAPVKSFMTYDWKKSQ